MRPYRFINNVAGRGWEMRWLRNEPWHRFWTKSIYEVRPLEPQPVTWCAPDGYWRLSPEPRDTDLGSIPPPLRGRFPHDQYPLAYIFHDEARAKGRLWHSDNFDGPYRQVAVSNLQGDVMLRDMTHHGYGAGPSRSNIIFLCVVAHSLFTRKKKHA